MPLADFRLEPMDIITYIKGEKECIVPILYMKMTLSYKGISIETQSPTLAETKSEFSFKGTLTQKVENIYTQIIQVKELTAGKVTTDELEATVAKIEELYATKAEIGDLVAGVIDVEELKAQIAEIDKAIINKADVTDLNAINATIESLKATVAEIDTLIADSILAEIIQSGSVSSDLLNVKDGFIEDAMIHSLSASKIDTGVINTNNVAIQSNNGNMLLQGNLLQFKDKNGKVRIQIGQDTTGNYTFTLYDETGNGVLINEKGIQSSNAIADGLIVDSKVSDNANINGSKLDISSVYDEMNADGSKTLKASKVMLDEQNQTLDVSFKEMTTKQDELEDSVSTAITDISVAQGQISQLIQDTTITTSEGTTTIKDAYSKLEQTVGGISSTVGEMESTLANKVGQEQIDQAIEQNQLTSDLVNKILDDNVITPNEKGELEYEFQKATLNKDSVSNFYNTLSDTTISNLKETMDIAYTTLENELTPILSDMTTSTNASNSSIRILFQEFYSAYETLLSAMQEITTNTTKNHSTRIEQLSNEITMSASKTESIDDKLQQIDAHMKFSADGFVEIYATQNGEKGKFATQITDKKLAFKENEVEVASISNEELKITKAEITNQLKIGRFVIKPSGTSNGGIIFAYE